MSTESLAPEVRVLIFAPVGRSAVLTRDLLVHEGMEARICASIADLVATMEEGAGVVLVTEQALSDPDVEELARALEHQPTWSDIPVVLFAGARATATLDRLRDLERLRNVTLLDRPIRLAAVVSAVQAALRARLRQYELRDVLVALQTARTEAERANRLKDEFLATLSHELRTPLNAILGWIVMLRRGLITEDQRPNALEIVERNARAQAQLIADVLDVSRMITGRIRLQLDAVPILEAVTDAVDSVRPTADAKGVSIVVDAAADVAASVQGDTERLRQIFWNLLSNAVKFTPRGGRVSVTLTSDAGFVECAVADSGIGLSSEFLPFAFDRFRQADQTFTRPHGGLGLGLAIVKHLVEMHGGQVTAASEGAGRGATFCVRLPLTAGPPVSARETSIAEGTTHDFEERLILVVDDDPMTRELLTTMLEGCHARVKAVGSVAAAMRQLDAEPPSLLLADLGMPGEDGLSLMRRVRQRPPAAGGSIPGVALSAYTRVEDRGAALDAGYDDFLTKPALPSDIVRTIARWLDDGETGVSRTTTRGGRH